MEFITRMPGRQAIVAFAVTIITGAILLSLPISHGQNPVSPLDALFTATSAVCVTGLTVVDVATDYSRFGQVVIMLLIQLGGLGIMTFTTGLFAALGSRMSYYDRLGINQAFAASGPVSFKSLLKAVIAITLLIEAGGAIALFVNFLPGYSVGEAAFHAVFHSVSAFCNAGFSTFSTNLRGYESNVTVLGIISFLIIAGGLGFVVVREIICKASDRRYRLSLHAKIALSATATLLILGTIIFLSMEYDNAYAHLDWPSRIANGFFQSVTPRTAGFDAILQNHLTEVSLLFTMFFMFIGALPGSTGGGIKASSAAIIFLLVFRRFQGRQAVTAFRRTISPESIVQALTVFMLAILFIMIALAALMFAQRPLAYGAESGWFVMHLFEVVSAFGTVGLSLGLTPNLFPMGKVIIIVTMFIGRVGLLTLAYSLARLPETGEVVYAEEPVMIG